MIEITRYIQWDMGHRIPNHQGKCKNPHGHRYKLEVRISGPINSSPGSSSEGMILDFGHVDHILKKNIYHGLQ